MTDAIADLSAIDLLSRFRKRTLSPVEATQAVLDRSAAATAVARSAFPRRSPASTD